MELQVVREGAKQFNENKDRENIDNQLPIDAINDSERKAMGGHTTAQGIRGCKKIKYQSRHRAHQRKQHDKDQGSNDYIKNPAIN